MQHAYTHKHIPHIHTYTYIYKFTYTYTYIYIYILENVRYHSSIEIKSLIQFTEHVVGSNIEIQYNILRKYKLKEMKKKCLGFFFFFSHSGQGVQYLIRILKMKFMKMHHIPKYLQTTFQARSSV